MRRVYTSRRMRLAEVNELQEESFVGALGGAFEHSPWIAQRAWRKRPFSSLDDLHRAMMSVVGASDRQEQLALVRAHPELAGREAAAGTLTAASSGEQQRLGFTRAAFERMATLNGSYREKFGFPCIIALRLHQTRESVMDEMQRRLGNNAEAELNNALEQIGHIARGRLEKMFGEE